MVHTSVLLLYFCVAASVVQAVFVGFVAVGVGVGVGVAVVVAVGDAVEILLTWLSVPQPASARAAKTTTGYNFFNVLPFWFFGVMPGGAKATGKSSALAGDTVEIAVQPGAVAGLPLVQRGDAGSPGRRTVRVVGSGRCRSRCRWSNRSRLSHRG